MIERIIRGGPAQNGLMIILDEKLVGRANCATELDESLARGENAYGFIFFGMNATSKAMRM